MSVVFHGSSPAIVKRSHIHCYWLERLPMFVPYNKEAEGDDVKLPVAEIADRAATEWRFTTTAPPDYSINDPRNLYVMGAIEFIDGRKIEFNQLFCYRFDAGTGEFVKIENRPDYQSEEIH